MIRALAGCALLLLVAEPAFARSTAAPDPQARLQSILADIDAGRFREALRGGDRLLAQADRNGDGDDDLVARIQLLRALSLEALGKPEEARKAGVAVAERTPSSDLGVAAIGMFGDIGDGPGEQAALDAFLPRFGDRARDLDFQQVRYLLPWIRDNQGKEAQENLIVRLADGGFGGEDLEARDSVTLQAARILAQRGDIAHAKKMADAIVMRPDMIEALTDRRYQMLWPALEQSAGTHMERIGRAAVIEAEQTSKTSPDSVVARLNLLRAYRDAGRPDDAERVGAAFATTSDELAKLDENGGWLVNDHAMLLAAMGKIDAADARFAALDALSIKDRPWLISMIINRVDVLVSHHGEAKALPLAEQAMALATSYGSPYARQLVRRQRICALHGLGRDSEAGALSADLIAHADDAPGATIDGYYCLNRPVDAEALAVKTLADPDKAGPLIAELQPDGASPIRGDPSLWGMFADRLRASPKVMAALNKVGRELPQAMWPTPIRE